MVDFDSEEMDVERDRLKAILEKQNYSYEELLNFAVTCLASFNDLNKRWEGKAEIDELLANLSDENDKSHKANILAMIELQCLQARRSLLDGIEDGIKFQKSSHAKKGAIGKKAKYQPLKELAAKLVNERKFKSKRNAAQTIAPIILAESRKLGIALSENQAEITITGWLTELGLPASI